MLTLQSVTKRTADMEKIEALFNSSFPKAERMPIWFLLWKAKKEGVDFLACYDQGSLVGMVYLITRNDLTFVLYLAVSSGMRSKGYGSRILEQVKSSYPNHRVILNIEALDDSADNRVQRAKRRNFYIRNGFGPAGFTSTNRDVTYEMLITGGFCTAEEYLSLTRMFTGSVIFPFVKPKINAVE